MYCQSVFNHSLESGAIADLALYRQMEILLIKFDCQLLMLILRNSLHYYIILWRNFRIIFLKKIKSRV